MTRWIVTGALAVATIAAGCTMKSQEAPPLTGPSGLGTSIEMTVSPDILAQDGASQSLVTINAFDSNGKPFKNLSMRSEILVDGVRTDFGSLSARNLVTDNNGRATLVYTAPAAPGGPAVDTNQTVTISVTPIGTDFGNSNSHIATIRLVPTGIVIPPSGLAPYFTVSNSSPADHQNIFFDACNDPAKPPCSAANNPIASYSWNFGDGGSASGRSTTHSYNSPGTFVATLTITDFVGRSASASQTIDVAGGDVPTASFTTSPSSPAVGATVNFNGAASKPATGRTIRTYDWDFGDGAQASTGGPTAAHAYSVAGTYTVTLVVTDDAGRTATATGTVTAGGDAPTASFTTSPSGPRVGETVNFNGAASKPATGRTIRSYGWDFGDGLQASTGGPTATHAYSAPGIYTATLVVTDDAGRTGTTTGTVTVASDSPTADFTFSQVPPTAGHTIQFNSAPSSAVTGRTIVSYFWDFGDTNTSTLASPAHPYSLPASYNVTLTVTDSAGKTGRVTKSVPVL